MRTIADLKDKYNKIENIQKTYTKKVNIRVQPVPLTKNFKKICSYIKITDDGFNFFFNLPIYIFLSLKLFI